MDRFAIFVDAGYLFAQGSALLAGSKQPRSLLHLKLPEVMTRLVDVAREHSDADRLLRVYWYDAPPYPGPLQGEHLELANIDGIKLRLGLLNSSRQQKGVDSLIVTDLIELARRRAMTDALLLSGDEDVRVGVQFAQKYGVRVILLGIHPARASQSSLLRQEADVCLEWEREDIDAVLEVARTDPDPGNLQVKEGDEGRRDAISEEDLAGIARSVLEASDGEELQSLKDHYRRTGRLKHDFDKRLLWRCRTYLGRILTEDEKRALRALVFVHLG